MVICVMREAEGKIRMGRMRNWEVEEEEEEEARRRRRPLIR